MAEQWWRWANDGDFSRGPTPIYYWRGPFIFDVGRIRFLSTRRGLWNVFLVKKIATIFRLPKYYLQFIIVNYLDSNMVYSLIFFSINWCQAFPCLCKVGNSSRQFGDGANQLSFLPMPIEQSVFIQWKREKTENTKKSFTCNICMLTKFSGKCNFPPQSYSTINTWHVFRHFYVRKQPSDLSDECTATQRLNSFLASIASPNRMFAVHDRAPPRQPQPPAIVCGLGHQLSGRLYYDAIKDQNDFDIKRWFERHISPRSIFIFISIFHFQPIPHFVVAIALNPRPPAALLVSWNCLAPCKFSQCKLLVGFATIVFDA